MSEIFETIFIVIIHVICEIQPRINYTQIELVAGYTAQNDDQLMDLEDQGVKMIVWTRVIIFYNLK